MQLKCNGERSRGKKREMMDLLDRAWTSRKRHSTPFRYGPEAICELSLVCSFIYLLQDPLPSTHFAFLPAVMWSPTPFLLLFRTPLSSPHIWPYFYENQICAHSIRGRMYYCNVSKCARFRRRTENNFYALRRNGGLARFPLLLVVPSLALFKWKGGCHGIGRSPLFPLIPL